VANAAPCALGPEFESSVRTDDFYQNPLLIAHQIEHRSIGLTGVNALNWQLNDTPAILKSEAFVRPLCPARMEQSVRKKKRVAGAAGLEPNQFQYQKVNALVGVEAVNAGNVRMIQGGQRFGFALEAGETLRITTDADGQNLARHVPAQLGIRRAIDLSHPTFSELGGDPVMSERRADHWVSRSDSFSLHSVALAGLPQAS